MKAALRRFTRIAIVAWAAPCSAIGLLFGLALVISGGQARRVGRVIEFSAYQLPPTGKSLVSMLPWSAVTLGHVVLGVSQWELERLRVHELVHVQQYERWGAIFFVAYPVASLYALLATGCPYKANWFEKQAIATGHRHKNAG
jgi:hypothetical protein